jgi:AraC-like DNA-binding protein
VQRATLDEYLRSPVGRWTSGDGWLHLCLPDPWLAGALFWGTLTAPGLADVLRCANASGRKIPEPHAALVDGRRVLSIDAACFAPASAYVLEHRSRLHATVAALGGVRPAGLFGAVAEGFFRIVPAPYPVAVFGERGEALRWLGCEGHAHTIEDVERLAVSTGGDDLLEPVHRAIEVDLVSPSVLAVARALGVSTRTLQRRLREAGTTFQHEVTTVRVRAAQRMMKETQHTLARIAQDAGFTSAATFSVAFRKLVGRSPREWRSVTSDDA